MSSTGASSLRGTGKSIMTTPNAFRAFTITQPDAFSKVEGVLFVVFVFVRRFMEFWNERPDMKSRFRTQFLRPSVHSCEEVYEPLANDIVADGDYQQLYGLDDGCEDIIHISVANGQGEYFKEPGHS